MENCIGIITDADFGDKKVELQNPITRIGARGIVFDKNGNIGVFIKHKIGEYKLPGGGVDNGETPKAAFERECIEEIGCSIKDIKYLGYIVEEKGYSNPHFTQTSHVFTANVKDVLSKPQFTEKEIAEGADFAWMKPEEAYEAIASCMNTLVASTYDKYEKPYTTKFMVMRDKKILESYFKFKEFQK